MKTLFSILLFAITNIGYSQFEVSTIEIEDETEKIAICNNESKSVLAKSSSIVLRKAVWGGMYLQFYYRTVGITTVNKNKELCFQFYDANNKLKHTYYTETMTYEKSGEGYLFYIHDKKLMDYFKKYTKTRLKVKDGGYGELSYTFSLKGFTSAYNEIFK